MVDTRCKGAPSAKKLSNGRPAKWSPSNRADMFQILKQEKVYDNKKFKLSKNSKVWQKVSKELINDDEQKTPERCYIHFMNMKREAGYIEHALKLEGVTWNKETSMLKPVEGGFEGGKWRGQDEKKHAKYAYTPYKYYDDIMQIIGKQKLRGVKKEEPVEESGEEEEPSEEDKAEVNAEAKDEPEEEKKPKPKTKADNKKASAKKPESTKAEGDKDAEEPSDEEPQQDTPLPKEETPKKTATTKAETDKAESVKGNDNNKSVAESKTSKLKTKPAALKHSKKMDAAVAERAKGGKVPATTQAKLPKNQDKGLETVAEDDEDVDMGNADDAAADSDEESAEENESNTMSAAADAVHNEDVKKANETQGIPTLKKWTEGVAVGDERKQGQKRTSSSPAPVSLNSERPRKQSRQASVPFGFGVTKSVNGAGKQKKDSKTESARSSTSRAGSTIMESTEKEATSYTSVRDASVARSLKLGSHDDLKQPFAELKLNPQDEAAREVQTDGMLTVQDKLAMTELFDDDAKAARMYLRVVDNIEMCKPWLEKQLQKIREDDWEDCML